MSDVRDRFLSWFSKPKVKSDGGYAKVSDAEFAELADLIHVLIEARWGSDEDGDLPIEFALVNRTTHHRLHFMPVPYGAGCGHHQDLNPESADAFLVDAEEHLGHMLNLRIAWDDATRMEGDLLRRARDAAKATIAKGDDRPALRGRKPRCP